MEAYEFVEKVAEGAYGSVWKCLDKTTKRVVAVRRGGEDCSSANFAVPPVTHPACAPSTPPQVKKLKDATPLGSEVRGGDDVLCCLGRSLLRPAVVFSLPRLPRPPSEHARGCMCACKVQGGEGTERGTWHVGLQKKVPGDGPRKRTRLN
jgi:hypothetical protein